MSLLDELKETERLFLEQLFAQSRQNPEAKISMYAVGQTLDMDRDTAKHTAEALIGLGYVEILTLAGDICITSDGIHAARSLQGAEAAGTPDAVTLGGAPVPDASVCRALEVLAGTLKSRISDLGLDFDTLGELMADLKSMDAQLASPKPKTAVLRACLAALQETLEAVGDRDMAVRIQKFLGP